MKRLHNVQDTRRRLGMIGLSVLLICGLAVLVPATVQAVAPRPGLLEELREQGRLEQYLAVRRAAIAAGVDAPVERAKGALRQRLASGSSTITYRVPCILVDFSDNPASGGGIASTPAMFDSMLFSTGINPSGSFKEFYEEVSYGQLNVVGTVVGWFRMPNTYAFYMNNAGGLDIPAYPRNSQGLVEVAIDSAAKYLDFSQFDNLPADGFVDGVMVVVPGVGGEETGDLGAIHSHRYSVKNQRFYNGKTIFDYTIQPEESNSTHGPLNAIGVFCHEWGHIFGLPDLYDLDDCDSLELCGQDLSFGLGDWSLMALGNWLPFNQSYSPAHFDAWSRIQLGFATATNVTLNQAQVVIPPVESSPTIYRLWDGGGGGSEYFLVEYRRRMGFDYRLPGSGLLIYHVDDTKGSNRKQWIEGFSPPTEHYWVAVEQADGFFGLEKYNDPGGSNDPYRSDSAGFDQVSYPSSKKYSGEPTEVAVWNISDTGATMTANFDVVYSRPFLEFSGYTANVTDGDGDQRIEQGETFELLLDITDQMKATSGVDVTVSAPGSGLQFNSSSYNIASIASGETHTNTGTPVSITVPADFRSTTIDFNVDISAESGTYHWSGNMSLSIGAPHTLLVDDDRGGTREQYYESSMDSSREVYDEWDVAVQGTPPLDTLMAYPVVFWFTGDSNSVSPTPEAMTVIKSYLDNDGRLLLTGQDIAENLLERGDTNFLNTYLGATYDGRELFPLFQGIADDPVGDGLYFNGAGAGSAPNQKSIDRLALTQGSSAVVCYQYFFAPKAPAGVHVENGYRLIFLGFGFEALPSGEPGSATREEALSRVMAWLDEGLATGVYEEPIDNVDPASIPRGFELSQNYPNPFNAGTVIPFIVTKPVSDVKLEVFNILGARVATLLDDHLEAGRYRVTWDGTDGYGRALASGIYLYRISVKGAKPVARRMVLLK